jgi:photosystem II stability/assembly factor-like uncharacterized protein
MKQALLLISISLAFSSVYAQSWNSQASGFADESRGINQIVITDENTAWATAYDGTGASTKVRDYTRTTDGGETWTAGTCPTPNNNYGWSCLAAIDANTAWAMFYRVSGSNDEGVVLKTTDGGTTWTQQGDEVIYAASASFPNVIYFWDADNGFAMGDPINGEFEIYTTTDGGDSWNAVGADAIPNPVSGEFGIVRVYGTYKETVWFGTNKGRVYKSTDKGYSWSVVELGNDFWVDEIRFKDDMNGWLTADDTDGGGDHIFMKTTDGGATWTDATPIAPYHYGSFTYVPKTDNTLVSTGVDFQNNDLGSSYSLDGGENWVEIDGEDQRLVVNFYSNIIGWCGGFNMDENTDGMFKFDGGFVATGIESVDPSVKWNLYPNPGNGLFYFSYEAANNEPIDVTVTDVSGKVIFHSRYHDLSQTWLRSVDLTDFGKGVYLMKVENNGNAFTQKLVVM